MFLQISNVCSSLFLSEKYVVLQREQQVRRSTLMIFRQLSLCSDENHSHILYNCFLLYTFLLNRGVDGRGKHDSCDWCDRCSGDNCEHYSKLACCMLLC